MSWVEQWARPGMTVLDVGANRGEIARELRQAIGPDGRLIAVEPHAEHTKALRAIADTVHVAVAGDHEGPTTLYLSAATEHASLYPANVPAALGSISVPMVRLDDLVEHVDLVKIDTQGAEVAILHGATRLLTEVRPIWYVEVWNTGLTNAGTSVEALCRLFQDAGYMPEHASWDAFIETANRNTHHSSEDVLVVPQERIAA